MGRSKREEIEEGIKIWPDNEEKGVREEEIWRERGQDKNGREKGWGRPGGNGNVHIVRGCGEVREKK